MCCQINSVSNAFRPMTLGARLATRSGDPPSPTPVMPASVSTRMIMLLWLNAAVMLFRFDPVLGVSTRTFVTMALGQGGCGLRQSGRCLRSAPPGPTPGCPRDGRAPPIAATVKDFANVLRSMFTCLLSGMPACRSEIFRGHILPLIPGFTGSHFVLASSPCLYC